jgi:two-component system response regulator (stage 0 sporulation protein F)
MSELITILYVDDEPINLMLFEAMFKTNHKVLSAESGLEGLKMLEANSDISVVISDMKMPNMNGLEFIKTAKVRYPNIVYCILSGYDLTDEIQDALDSKTIQKYFQKPFKMDEIEIAITETLINN